MNHTGLAFVFPGQGSQRVGMLDQAYAASAVVRDTLREASEVLGYSLWDLINSGDQAALNLTETTQPVLLACSVALWRYWCERGGPQPQIMAGHSLGEFSALCCAGAIGFADALRLVRQRGAFMQAAVPVGEGSMAAVLGLEDARIVAVCAEVSTGAAHLVQAVNFNSPGQVVIAGHSAAVAEASEQLKAAGARRCLPLPVSAPFHTSLMQPAGERLRAVLEGVSIHTPSIPVLHNVHAATESDPQRIRELLVQQIASPVQWTECVRQMAARGVQHVAECGPGRVLGGLNRRIDASLHSHYLETPQELQALCQALSQRDAAGV